jgi:hypothetical protein
MLALYLNALAGAEPTGSYIEISYKRPGRYGGVDAIERVEVEARVRLVIAKRHGRKAA